MSEDFAEQGSRARDDALSLCDTVVKRIATSFFGNGHGEDCVEVNIAVLSEAFIRANKTLGETGLKEPNAVKQAGHYAFWIRKLKPISVSKVEDVKTRVDGLVKKGLLIGGVSVAKPTPKLPGKNLLNEAFAIMVAIGFVEASNTHRIKSKGKEFVIACHDLIVSLRYNSFSPSAISAVLLAHAERIPSADGAAAQ